jgi:hypothetical protein
MIFVGCYPRQGERNQRCGNYPRPEKWPMLPKYSFRCEYVRCNKGACRSCPHGPYWYGYFREGEKTRKRYFGRKDPRECDRGEREAATPTQATADHPWDAILCSKTASLKLAREILGVPLSAHPETWKAAYVALVKKHHPDRGGDHRTMCWVNAAMSWARAFFKWK